MPCFHPLEGYKTSTGKWISNKTHCLQEPLTIPCRQCTGCRQEYARQWAMRNIHEASLWLNNIFITLTYDNEHIPEHNTLRS